MPCIMFNCEFYSGASLSWQVRRFSRNVRVPPRHGCVVICVVMIDLPRHRKISHKWSCGDTGIERGSGPNGVTLQLTQVARPWDCHVSPMTLYYIYPMHYFSCVYVGFCRFRHAHAPPSLWIFGVVLAPSLILRYALFDLSIYDCAFIVFHI